MRLHPSSRLVFRRRCLLACHGIWLSSVFALLPAPVNQIFAGFAQLFSCLKSKEIHFFFLSSLTTSINGVKTS